MSRLRDVRLRLRRGGGRGLDHGRERRGARSAALDENDGHRAEEGSCDEQVDPARRTIPNRVGASGTQARIRKRLSHGVTELATGREAGGGIFGHTSCHEDRTELLGRACGCSGLMIGAGVDAPIAAATDKRSSPGNARSPVTAS